MLPMVCVMLAAIVAMSALNAYFSLQRTRLRIEHALSDVVSTLADSNFPLTDGVLHKMRGFSGAEFVLMDRDGVVFASSMPRGTPIEWDSISASSTQDPLTLGNPISLGDGRFFHASLDLQRISGENRSATLHMLYPEKSYHEAWRHAVYPPLLVGAVAIVLVIALGLAIASRVTRPLHRLQSQVGEIAEGDFRSMPVPRKEDEIADLSRSINRMAEMLADYERNIRQNERLHTLGQLGGGIAHQIRNSVTGCRLAVELHASECQQQGDGESLRVAIRQLELMEKYLQRFLRLGRVGATSHVQTNLVAVVENVVSLVGPTARHVGVELQWEPPDGPTSIQGDADSLEQMLVNLVLNAVEAASAAKTISSSTDRPQESTQKKVAVSLSREDRRVFLEVSDTGDGPDADVRQNLFDPFVTGKPDGTGLGLSMAREIAIAHHGEICWYRRNATTHFVFELPEASPSCKADTVF